MPPETRRERNKGELRREILDAARDLFARNHHEAVTLAKIAERAEYTAPTILNHFGSKEGLIFAICDEDFRALRRAFERVAKVADPVERLRRIGLVYVDFAMGHPNHYRFMFMTPHPRARPLGPRRSTGAIRTRTPTRSSARRSPRRSRRGGSATSATTPTWSPRCSGAGCTGWSRSTSTRGTTPAWPFRPVKGTARLLVDVTIRGLLRGGD